MRDTALRSRSITDLIATYEELLPVPHKERITYYYGDYGSHFFNYGVTDEQIASTYQKALEAMEMDDADFQAWSKAHPYREDMINRMRDCLSAQELCAGELESGSPIQEMTLQ